MSTIANISTFDAWRNQTWEDVKSATEIKEFSQFANILKSIFSFSTKTETLFKENSFKEFSITMYLGTQLNWRVEKIERDNVEIIEQQKEYSLESFKDIIKDKVEEKEGLLLSKIMDNALKLFGNPLVVGEGYSFKKKGIKDLELSYQWKFKGHWVELNFIVNF